MAPVLVAYATVYGSTQEVAEAAAKTLRERGLEVDVRPASEVSSLDGYSGVVLGGSLYFFLWHRDARRFLKRHRAALAKLPVAVFALGPFTNEPSDIEGARRPVDRVLAKHAWLKPVAVQVFGGRLDPERLHFPHSNPAMRSAPPSDARDWDAIGAWADSLSAAFGGAPAASGD